MFSQFKPEANDNDVEYLFRQNDAKISNARQAVQQLNELVALIGNKYQLSDVWGRTYKADPDKMSVRFAYSDINGMADKHPIVKLFEAHNIQQTLEKHDKMQHLRYSIFTFDSSQCPAILKAVNLLNPDPDELKKLTKHSMNHKVLC